MKKIVKLILWLLVIAGGVAAYLVNTSKPIKLETTTLTKQTAEVYFIEDGIVTSDDITDIYPLVNGEIASVHVVDDQQVKAGDVLFTIDKTDLESQVKQLQAATKGFAAQKSNLAQQEQKRRDDLKTSKETLMGELEKATTQYATSETTLAEQTRLQQLVVSQIKTDLAYEKEQYEKTNTLFAAGALQKSDVDAALSKVQGLESSLAQAEQQLEVIRSSDGAVAFDVTKKSLQTQIEYTNDSLRKNYNESMMQYYDTQIEGNNAALALLNKKLADCTITAPTDGIAKDVVGTTKSICTPSTRLLTVINEANRMVECFISVQDLNECHIGDAVSLTLKQRIGDVTFDGIIHKIGRTAEIKTSPLGVEERRVKIDIMPTVPEGITLLDGAQLDTTFTVYKQADKLLVPKTALFTVSDQDTVWVIRDGMLAMANVTKGVETRTDYVVEGLHEGDVVVKDANIDGLKIGKKAVSS